MRNERFAQKSRKQEKGNTINSEFLIMNYPITPNIRNKGIRLSIQKEEKDNLVHSPESKVQSLPTHPLT